MRPTLSLALIGVMLAGCSGTPDPSGSTTLETSSSSFSSPGTSNVPTSTETPPLPPFNATVLGNTCEGLVANTRYPLTTAPGDTPPGWTLALADQTHVFNEWISCERVKVGSYDRPARIIFDAHNKATPPDTCVEGYVGALFIVEQVLVNDTAIAAHLASAFRLPVVVATIDYSTSPGPGAGLVSYNWAWNATAAPVSRVALNSTDEDARPYEVTTRYVWENGKGISYLDLTDKFGLTTLDNKVLVGDMQPPMLYTQGDKPNPYIGQGEVMYDYSFEGEFHAFGDYQCKEPLAF